MLYILVVLGFLFGNVSVAENAFSSFEHFKKTYSSSEGILLDRNGIALQEIRIHFKNRRLEWVSLSEISPYLLNSVIIVEDKNFWHHHGVDWLAVLRASIVNLWNKKQRGASTITMQLASQISLQSSDSNKKNSFKRKNFFQKWFQIQLALKLEKNWTKNEIFEAYLNTISYRGELEGIHTASRALFLKSPDSLDREESLILASLIRSPEASLQNILKRAENLSKILKIEFHPERFQFLSSRNYKIFDQKNFAPHLAYRLKKNLKDQGTINTTLDFSVQRFVSETLRSHILPLQSQNVQDACALVVDNLTGEVLAYVGGIGEGSSAWYVDGVKAQRQAGSTLKPFLYALAFEKKYLTPGSLLSDLPLEVSLESGIYRPKNYISRDYEPYVSLTDHNSETVTHQGVVNVRKALGSSLNIPAVRVIQFLGVDVFLNFLKKLGFQNLNDAHFYGPSLALGSAEVSLWDLVNSYRTLANLGQWSELQFQKTLQPAQKLISSQSSFLVSNILSDREARSLSFGLENSLSLPFWSAVKTGTSKDMRDNWCVGYSNRYTVGVWVGNFSGEPMWNVTGVTGAAPIWASIMKYVHQNLSHSNLKINDLAHAPTGVIQKSNEWYIEGTEPEFEEMSFNKKDQLPVSAWKKINYPSAHTIFALDPDIPPHQQKILFKSNVENADYAWVLNQKKLASAKKSYLWSPSKRGKYLLSLQDKAGKVIDEVPFSIR